MLFIFKYAFITVRHSIYIDMPTLLSAAIPALVGGAIEIQLID